MKTIDKVRAADTAATGKRYCTAHGGDADAATGKILKVRGTSRFVCARCLKARKSAAAHAAGAPAP